MTSEHADLLNALNDMQNNLVYAMRRSTLREAERLIVSQEKRINELERQLVAAPGLLSAAKSVIATRDAIIEAGDDTEKIARIVTEEIKSDDVLRAAIAKAEPQS